MVTMVVLIFFSFSKFFIVTHNIYIYTYFVEFLFFVWKCTSLGAYAKRVSRKPEPLPRADVCGSNLFRCESRGGGVKNKKTKKRIDGDSFFRHSASDAAVHNTGQSPTAPNEFCIIFSIFFAFVKRVLYHILNFFFFPDAFLRR